MKKLGLPIVFAVFVVLAPVVRADDGSVLGSFEQLIGQLVALFSGDDEIGELFPPFGVAKPADQSELGEICPPWG